MNYKAMGRRIKAKRKSQHKTQEDVAKAVDISLSFYGNIERGIRIPSLETLVGIANVLSVSMDYLLNESLTPRPGRDKNDVRSVIRYLKDQVDELEGEDEDDAGDDELLDDE